MDDKRLFSIAQVVAWVGATGAGVAAVVVFCFATFQTKSDAAGDAAAIESRQDRMGKFVGDGFNRMDDKLGRLNDKVDQILMNQRRFH